jgi:hypothetical protein
MRWVVGALAVFLLFFVWVPLLRAAPPEAREALVWVSNVWDGTVYRTTFDPPAARTLYGLTGQPLVLRLTRTLVYYWPLTRRYEADWLTRDETVTGILEVRQGSTRVATLRLTDYVIQSPAGDFNAQTILYTGTAARDKFAEYQEEQDRYREAVAAYSAARGPAAGGSAPTPPEPPALATTNVTPGFIVDLPVGRYTVRLLAPDGADVPTSERELVIFAPRRRGVAYQVIPEERWTAPEVSLTSTDTIYTSGAQTVFVVPYSAIEVPVREYTGLRDPQDHSGWRGGWRWVLAAPLKGQAMRVHSRDHAPSVPYRLYEVAQMAGPMLGYRVEEARPGRTPSFGGYRLALKPGFGQAQITLGDDASSLRQIRQLATDGGLLGLRMTAILVAAFGIGSAVRRRSRLPGD